MKPSPRLLFPLIAVALLIWAFLRPTTIIHVDREKGASNAATSDPDADLVHSLLSENLSRRTFSFATVVNACSGKKVVPLDASPVHLRVTAAIGKALDASLAELSRPDSPVQKLRRINEASRLFEDAILRHLQETPGIACEIPRTRSGAHQRSGYPDLRITDTATGSVFYLDPKLVASGSKASSFRSFYFEPKDSTLKITDDAVHLLAGISHDSNNGAWAFTRWQLVDLSPLRVRLKAEFQASNADLYGGPAKPALPLPETHR